MRGSEIIGRSLQLQFDLLPSRVEVAFANAIPRGREDRSNEEVLELVNTRTGDIDERTDVVWHTIIWTRQSEINRYKLVPPGLTLSSEKIKNIINK